MVPVITALMVLFAALQSQAHADPAIKSPNVAGSFYTADPTLLSQQIDQFLAQAGDILPEGQGVQIAIAPHAGYVYSASVAARTFKALSKNTYTTVVVIAPSHYYPFRGAAVWPRGGFKTPLGTVMVDEDFTGELLKKASVAQELPAVFEQEHALEVELPFVQKVFPKARIVPVLMGQPELGVCSSLAQALHELIGDRKDVLVLISSDMSHYHPYADANAMDAKTLETVKLGNIEGFWNGIQGGSMEMCGAVPVTVGMMLARLRGDTVAQVLQYANSGDTAGDKAKVVGYGAVLFYKPSELNSRQGKYLLHLARNAIENHVRYGTTSEMDIADPRLQQVQGAFVTINKNKQLRGCIGNIIGQKPLIETVRSMAVAAASEDPRFPPVKAEELGEIEVEVSVLSVPRMVKDAEEIVLGQDGVIVSDRGGHQGVFLPQVATETSWTKERFLSELCSQKAGLPEDCWKDPKNSLFTFTAQVLHEK